METQDSIAGIRSTAAHPGSRNNHPYWGGMSTAKGRCRGCQLHCHAHPSGWLAEVIGGTTRDYSHVFIPTKGTAIDYFISIMRSLSITNWFGLSSKAPGAKNCFNLLSLHRLWRKSHLELQKKCSWESGFHAGDEMQCVYNVLWSPSDFVASL